MQMVSSIDLNDDGFIDGADLWESSREVGATARGVLPTSTAMAWSMVHA